MKMIFVGGTFDDTGGAESKVIKKMCDYLFQNANALLHLDYLYVEYKNGGTMSDIKKILSVMKNEKPDVVFWFPNVGNEEEKYRNIKELCPKTMLITSKRNDNDKYSFQELVQHSLRLKANLTFEFSKQHDGQFKIRVFDPLGCEYYYGMSIPAAMYACIDRLGFISKMTRKNTTAALEDKNSILEYYLSSLTNMHPSNQIIPIPEVEHFVSIVKEQAEIFQKLMEPVDIKRFLGNASLKLPPQIGRCNKGMPSFRYQDYIFVSQRNIDKQFIAAENFVPVYEQDGKIYYCGDKKPSVDTPVQLKLYQELPNIRYMIHSHHYIQNAPFTKTPIPCGAVEEADEILSVIYREYTKSTSCCAVNLLGHGSIIMAKKPDTLRQYTPLYYKRTLPEKM